MIGGRTYGAANEQGALDHTTRYETLRAYAIQRHTLASREGLVVLLRQGVAAWVDAWSRLPAPPAPPSVLSEDQRSSLLADDVGAEVVRILAAMALTHIQEAHA